MTEKFCNPVPFGDGKRHTNPDPFVLRWCGKYYCYATDEAGVKVSVSEDLVHWTYRGYAIAEKEYHHYWAPSVIYRNGIFYMYYSNIPIEETDCHQEHLKLAVAGEPLGPFVYQKTFFDQFSIDSHPVLWGGEQYMFYSVNDWLGTEEKVSGTCILLDRMKTPEEFSGNPRPVVLPGIRQEIYAADRFGDGRDWYTIEGACPVVHGDRCWLLYSANAYENVDYFIGTAVADRKKKLEKMKWEKVPDPYTWTPLLKKNDMVEGTGHNTVTKAPNLVDDWIVYHGRNAREELRPGTEQREMRIDPLYYSGNRLYCPGPGAQEQPAPGKARQRMEKQTLETKTLLGEGGLFYAAELWISAEKSHTGARFGILADEQENGDYTEIQIYTGQGLIKAVSCRGGLRTECKSAPLPKGYDYTVPHLFRIQRNGPDYEVTVDEELSFGFYAEQGAGDGRIGIMPYFTRVTLHSFAMTGCMELSGRKLRHLSHLYRTSRAVVSKEGCRGIGEELILDAADNFSQNYVEEFSVEVTAGENEWRIDCGERTLFRTGGRTGCYSLYHGIEDGAEWFWTDTERIVLEGPVDRSARRISLKGLKIVFYRYVENP